MKKVLITTVPFADKNPIPLQMLEAAGIEYLINPLGRKLNEKELALMVSDFDAIIAGTEKITDDVMENGKNLRLISRVGIGLDSVDLLAAKRRGVKVSYTPDAPSPAIAEFTVGLMLTMLHSVHLSNFQMHVGHWNRYFGRRIPDVTIGVIGLGRIGKRVLNLLRSFGSPKLLLNDISPNLEIDREFKVEWVTKEEIYKQADVITFHLPLTKESKNMVRKEHLKMMKPDAILINTARGGIINEDDLYDVMNEGHLSGASIDVFVQEPYSGRLREIDRCILTAHMGSSSLDCRTRMEREATEEAVRFLTGKPLEGLVPEHEYTIQREGLER
jgi:D-3-phosphoglycerate dehydrogenase / 2-oxoglutarate reductase